VNAKAGKKIAKLMVVLCLEHWANPRVMVSVVSKDAVMLLRVAGGHDERD